MISVLKGEKHDVLIAMEGTSEASLAASAPREAQMLYQPMNRGQDLTGRDSGVRSSPERQSSDLS